MPKTKKTKSKSKANGSKEKVQKSNGKKVKKTKSDSSFPHKTVKVNLLKRAECDRAAKDATIFMAAVLDYLVAELADCVMQTKTSDGHTVTKKIITSEDIRLTIRGDEELSALCKDIDILQTKVKGVSTSQTDDETEEYETEEGDDSSTGKGEDIDG